MSRVALPHPLRAGLRSRRDGADATPDTTTRVGPRLGAPSRIPPVDQAAQAEWVAGWWAGLAVGAVNGVALAVVLGWLR